MHGLYQSLFHTIYGLLKKVCSHTETREPRREGDGDAKGKRSIETGKMHKYSIRTDGHRSLSHQRWRSFCASWKAVPQSSKMCARERTRLSRSLYPSKDNGIFN